MSHRWVGSRGRTTSSPTTSTTSSPTMVPPASCTPRKWFKSTSLPGSPRAPPQSKARKANNQPTYLRNTVASSSRGSTAFAQNSKSSICCLAIRPTRTNRGNRDRRARRELSRARSFSRRKILICFRRISCNCSPSWPKIH